MTISLDEIRSKAPDGATHYREWFNTVSYYKVISGVIIHGIKECGCIYEVDWSINQAYAYNKNELKPLN